MCQRIVTSIFALYKYSYTNLLTYKLLHLVPRFSKVGGDAIG